MALIMLFPVVGLAAPGTVQVGTDIWTPIGSSTNQFGGLFDGGGHTISGLYTDLNASCQGFFGYIGPGGSVKNVTVSGVVAGRLRSEP